MKTPASSTRSRSAGHLQIAYQLDALLHTMRAVARAEEQLCSLMHSIERERTLPARARRELLHLLQDLPTDTCDADRHAILDALGDAAPAPPARSSPAARRPVTPAATKLPRSSTEAQGSKPVGSRRAKSAPARKASSPKAPARKAATARATRASRKRP